MNHPLHTHGAGSRPSLRRVIGSGAYGCRTAAVYGLLVLILAGAYSTPAQAQTPRYTLAFRGVPLDEALDQFAGVTGVPLAYDPALVQDHRAYCTAVDEPAEEVLRCILSESGLDFYRLSSGTYVLTSPPEVEPQPGYLTGSVTDRETGSPLANAHVFLADAGLGTVTNQAGHFTFPPLLPGSYTVCVTHVGYVPWMDTLFVSTSERVHATAALQAETIFITPIVVDGMAQRLPASELGRGTLDADRTPVGMASRHPATFQALGALAGVRVSDATADVHVQGGDAGAHQVFLDGVPVFLPRKATSLVGPFAPLALERITVEKAGFDATLGSQTSGVILIDHDVESTDRLDVQLDPLSVQARSHMTRTFRPGAALGVTLGARFGLWSLYAPPPLRSTLTDWTRPDPFLLLPSGSSAGTNPSPLLSELAEAAAERAPELHFNDVHAASRLRLFPLHSVFASAYRGTSRLTRSAAPERSLLTYDGPQAIFTVNDAYRWETRLAQIRYDAVLGNHSLLSTQLYASRYTLGHDYQAADSLLIHLESDTLSNNDPLLALHDGNRILTTGLKGSLDYARGPHHLRAGTEVTRSTSRFSLYGVHFPESEPIAVSEATAVHDYLNSSALPVVRHTSSSLHIAAFVHEDARLSRSTHLEAGLRLTYLPRRSTVYAEPRLALRHTRGHGPFGPWSARLAAGLYRQYRNQFDVSVLNAGAILPSVRIWLPIDASVRPPMAYHLSQEVLLHPATRWTVRLEAYYKFQPHGLTLHYAPALDTDAATDLTDQAEFLAPTRGWTYGTAVSVEGRYDSFRIRTLYEFSRSMRRSPVLFSGRRHPAPWSEPHRLELDVDWRATPQLTLSTRWQGTFGRTWGFRQVYYDYFAHDSDTRHYGPYDLGTPSDHRLPPTLRTDISLAYSRTLGNATLQLRLDLLNALNYKNVLDWRLIKDGDQWRTDARHLFPRTPLLAIRFRY